MNRPFGALYAAAYDLLYGEKDYQAECDLIETIFDGCGKEVRSVLDLGCGTGNHAIPLAERGYTVLGVDSSPDMLARAREKVAAGRGTGMVEFREADVREVTLDQTFDAVIMMFAVLSYHTGNADVLGVLEAARRHLASDGLLLADIWYGPAVLATRPEERVRVLRDGGRTVIRVSSGQLDVQRHLCRVHYRLWHLNGNELVEEAEEEHTVRFFFPEELRLFLEMSGFRLLRLGCFPEFDRDPDEESWNAMLVAAAS